MSSKITIGLWIRCGVAAGVTMFLVGVAVHFLIPVIAPGLSQQFLDPPFRIWTEGPSTYMPIHPFVYGFIFAAIFIGLRRTSFPSGPGGGLLFGLGVFVVGSLPVYLLVIASFVVSGGVIASWILQSLVQYALAGITVGCVADRMTPYCYFKKSSGTRNTSSTHSELVRERTS